MFRSSRSSTGFRSRLATSVLGLSTLGLLLVSCGSQSPTETQTPAANASGAARLTTLATDTDLLPLVNPFVGTKIGNAAPGNQGTGGAVGNTFPGATLPFGMVQFSPDTGYGEFYGFGGYKYDKGVIQGLSLIHSSGTGCTIQQDVPFMPFVGNIGASPGTNLESYQQPFSHSNEKATPGFYQVGLGNGVNAELTVSRRTGAGRFTYPATNDAGMIVNVGRNGVGARSAQLEIVGNDSVQGSVETGGVCGGGGYFVYFYAQFDRPFASFGTYQGAAVTAGSRTAARATQNGGWVKFGGGGGQIKMRVGVSYVSSANAKLNMQTENPSYDFDGLKTAAQATWNSTLNKVQITGGSSDDRTKFYTALYHSLLHPNLFSDVNGQYIGFDNKIYTASGWDKYATFSGWDVYRSQMQFIGWLFPKVGSDMAQSLVVDADKGGGGYPKWPTANDDTCVMVGDAGAVIVANMHAFGARNFDTALALRLMDGAATQPGTRSRNCETRVGLSDQLSRGYVSTAVTNGWGGSGGQGAITLEYALADAAIGQFAGALGDTAKRDNYLRRAQAWKTLFSGYSGYIQTRDALGSFVNNFNRASGDGFVEGNSAQYTWMVPQNYRGLFDAIGGNAAATARLDEHFTQLDAGPDSPYAFMGNEPEHGTPWAYNFAGAPYKTQAVVRRILSELYRSGPDGLTGNDDLGASSVWYVWGALGLYPELPGVGGFTLGSPLFPAVSVRMGNDHTLNITASSGAGSTYIQSLKVNGQTSTSTWLPLASLGGDSTLEFALGSAPNTAWGSAAADAPPSYDDPAITRNASSFSTDFESGLNQPNWNDTMDFAANVGGYCCGLNHMESSTRREGVARSGTTSLLYAGTDNDATRSFSYNKVFDVNIPVTASTTLSYWIRPDSAANNSSYVAVDLLFTDGSSLRESGALDQNGVRVHPQFQGQGGKLRSDAWNEVRSTIGTWAAGKTIDRILVGYDRPDATGNFRGSIDDIQIEQGGTPPTGVSLTVGGTAAFQVATPGYTDRYLRHANSLAATEVVSASSDSTLKQDASWKIRAGLADPACYSFEASNFPNSYLRHSGSRLRIDPPPSGDRSLFDKDATFCAKTGLDGGAGTISLASQNYPDRYIRHRNSEVWVEANDNGGSYKADASWRVAPGF